MTTQPPTTGYDPFTVKPLQVRTRRIFAPTGGSISFATAVFIAASWSACFYLLVPLEYIRPDIIGWNRSARARELLTKRDEEQKIIVK
ncbi:unnamed protein product [Adineta steineri]|uniref:Uncharacterized protein n=1 Tax=Adineta steineri TaxID=433720 RepID=A0A818WHW7_9BILA|nr:unnamed protein product [Adineta steineri]